jgi:hypothetical protein
MKTIVRLSVGLFAFASFAGVAALCVDQVNRTLGSPSATVTLDGKQLPPPMKFGGVR